MRIDAKFVELTADVVGIILLKNDRSDCHVRLIRYTSLPDGLFFFVQYNEHEKHGDA